MDKSIYFSVIIPQRNAVDTLSKLLDSIPNDPRIEVIVIDNTPEPIKSEQIHTKREFKLLWSSPTKHAGGARNKGVSHAKGKWLIFADADDYFAPTAFQTFFSKYDSESDIVFYMARGEYADTQEPSTRADVYNNLVFTYLDKKQEETNIRLYYSVPWAKMLKSDFVKNGGYKFDEIRAGNDIYFSTTTGYNAKIIEAVRTQVYVVTVSRGSLTQRRDYEVVKARLISILKCNQFMRKQDLKEYQHSVMFALVESRRFGLKIMIEFFNLIISYKQNPFINWQNWILTLFLRLKNRKKIIDI